VTRGQGDEPRIGVFVCECGGKIAGLLDVESLAQAIGKLPKVVWAGHASYWCMPKGLECVKTIVSEQQLNRVVIAGCAPRTHEAHFRQALDGRVSPTFVNVINLRDLCARPHQADQAAAKEKASDQVAMAIADLAARATGQPRVAHIMAQAIVIGGGIAGMTAAIAINDAGIPVTLVEREPDLGGLAGRFPDDGETARLVAERMVTVRARPNVQVLTSTQVARVDGSVGRYQILLSNGQVVEAGAVIVATGGRRSPPDVQESNLASASPPRRYAFVLCDAAPEHEQACLHSCCLSALRQAAEIKRQVTGAEVTIFFRELYTAGGAYNALVWEAQRLGVSFYRYPAGRAPQSIGSKIVAHDELTGRDVRVPCDVMIPATPMTPQEDSAHLAGMLRLPIDAAGFLADTRVRLRPADRIERGIYVCGAAHFPCEAQRAMFEAYSAAAHAVRHIQRGEITNWATAATIDPHRCNGCGDCVRVCPFMAITMRQGDQGTTGQGESRLATVDPFLCTGCGNCVSVCPVKAAQVATATDEQIEAQIRAALHSQDQIVTPSPRHLVMACEWSGYSAAEVAGAQGLAYPASTRIIRLNCTGRLQPGLILKALEIGAAGVMVLGCAPGLCHYEQGNERCAAAFEQANGLARLLALDNRLKLEWIPPDDGERFVQVVADFVTGLEDQVPVKRET
jgi:heterodisulfide reductase subunit A